MCTLLWECKTDTLHIRVFLSAIWINNLIALTWLEHAIISGRSWVESADQRVSTLHPVGLESVQTAAKRIDTFTREEREKTSTKLITRDGQGKKSRNRKRQNILDTNNNKNNNKQSKTLKSHTYDIVCMSKRRRWLNFIHTCIFKNSGFLWAPVARLTGSITKSSTFFSKIVARTRAVQVDPGSPYIFSAISAKFSFKSTLQLFVCNKN